MRSIFTNVSSAWLPPFGALVDYISGEKLTTVKLPIIFVTYSFSLCLCFYAFCSLSFGSPPSFHLCSLLSSSVSEPICILTSFPLRDCSKWIHGEKHQEELPGHAPVHGEISSNWRPGCTCQPQIRVTDLWSSISSQNTTCQSLRKHYSTVCMCEREREIWSVCVCVTAPLRLGMNGLPHWEQQELFLELASITALVMLVCFGHILMTKDLRAQKTNLSISQSAGPAFESAQACRIKFVREEA